MRTPNTISEAMENKQQPAGDPEGRQPDAELPQQPVADQRRPAQDEQGDQAGADRDLASGRDAAGRAVSEVKIGTSPTGSTTTSRVTSAEMKNSGGIQRHLARAGKKGNAAAAAKTCKSEQIKPLKSN